MDRPTDSLERRFSRSAATYDFSAGVQTAVAETVAELFSEIMPVRSVLEIGCGTGLLTQRLCAHLDRRATLYRAMDLSGEMLEQTRRKLRGTCAVELIQDDFLAYACDMTFEGIVSSAALHWIVPLEQTVQRCRQLLLPGGHLVFGMMVSGTLAELHSVRRQVAPSKPVGNLLPTAEHIINLLEKCRLAVKRQWVQEYPVELGSAEELLRSLHDQGVTGGGVFSGRQLLSRGELKDLTRRYNENHSTASGGVCAQYRVLFVHAQRDQE
ncbi:MAG: methyltransferase [Pirellulaceae bacterium]